MNDVVQLIQENFNVKLSLDQIQSIVDMGDNPSDYDLARIEAMVKRGSSDVVTQESVGPLSTNILHFIRGFEPQNDTLYFDSWMVIPRKTDGEP